MVALLRGEFADAEQLILADGNQPRSRIHNADQLSMQIFTLRREQGRLAEFRPIVSQFVSAALAASDLAARDWR